MKSRSFLFLASVICFLSLTSESCRQEAKSSSGVSKATATVTTDPNGFTVEQQNIMEKIKRDNEPGKIRHLYQISAYTGSVLEYHTVKGKITSGQKRLNPKTADNSSGSYGTFSVDGSYYTNEVLGDDGAYGDSMPYMFFFDTKDQYHQIFPTGGTYIHISETPLTINKANLIFAIKD